MKCDIRKYFETMNHGVLKQMILNKFSDDQLKRLLFKMVSEELKLELKKELQHWFPVTQGIQFLGFRIFPGTIRLQRKTIVRFRKIVRKKETQYIEGKITENQLASSVQSMVAHILWGNTFQMRQQFFN